MSSSGPICCLQGVNSITGEGLDSIAIQGKIENVDGVSEAIASVCTSESEMYSSLEISASIDVSVIGLGGASAKTSFLTENRMTSTSLVVLVQSRHVIGDERCVNAELKRDVAVPNNDNEARNFYKKYGDSYVSRIKKGAHFYGSYHFRSTSTEQRDKLTADLKAHGLIECVAVKAEFHASMEEMSKKHDASLSISFKVEGIRDPAPMGTSGTYQDLVAYALNFQGQPVTSPTILHYELKTYASMFPGTGFDRFQMIEGFTSNIAPTYRILREVVSQCDDIDSLCTAYTINPEGAEKFAKEYSAYKADFAALKKAVESFIQNPFTFESLKNFPRTDSLNALASHGHASLGCELTVSAQFPEAHASDSGWSLGSSFQLSDIIPRRIRITGIKANTFQADKDDRHVGTFTALSTYSYEESGETIRCDFGMDRWDDNSGRMIMNERLFDLGDGEYVTSLNAYASSQDRGTYSVWAMWAGTNLHPSQYGIGVQHIWEDCGRAWLTYDNIPANWRFAALRVLGGDRIKGVQYVFVAFDPIKWMPVRRSWKQALQNFKDATA